MQCIYRISYIVAATYIVGVPGTSKEREIVATCFKLESTLFSESGESFDSLQDSTFIMISVPSYYAAPFLLPPVLVLCGTNLPKNLCSLSCAARPLDAVGSRRSFHCAYKQSRKRATTNQTATKMIQRIPVSRPFDNEESSFWAGIHQHRDRRLAYRQRQQQADTTENENRDADFSQLPSFNCYDVMYTGTIQMGTPSQSFNVKLDTSTSISWLPSERCDQTCRYLHIPKYNPYTSSTFKSIDASLPSEFLEKYPNEENSISVRHVTNVCFIFVLHHAVKLFCTSHV